MESLDRLVELTLKQYANDEIMVNAFMQWALNPTSMSAGYGVNKNYEDIERNLSRIYYLSKIDAARNVQTLKEEIAKLVQNHEIYAIRNAIEKTLEGEIGNVLCEGLSKRLSQTEGQVQRFATLLSRLLNDFSLSALGSKLNYGMDELEAIYVATYGEIIPEEKLEAGLLDVGALYRLTWITAKHYYNQNLVIMPLLCKATAHLMDSFTQPDVVKYIHALFDGQNYELLRLLEDVANTPYDSMFGVAKAPEGISEFVSSKGISGKYRDIVAVNPSLQAQLQECLSKEKEDQLKQIAKRLDIVLTDLRNKVYPRGELLRQDVGKDQRLWIWEAVDCPRLYIYLTSWLTLKEFSKIQFDGPDPHLLVIVTHQSIPRAKEFIEKRYYGPLWVAHLGTGGIIPQAVRGEKHKYIEGILEQLSGSPAKITFDQPIEGNPKKTREAKLEREKLEEPEFAELCIGNDQVPAEYGLLGWTIEGKTVFLDLKKEKTISVFGRQGAGKSYTVGAIAEMSLLNIPKINHLTVPLSVIVFHYSNNEGYRPEYATLHQPNDKEQEIEALKSKLNVSPLGVKEVIVVVPPHKLEKRRKEYPGLEVYPLQFNPSELKLDDWQMLMAASGTEALYMEELKRILKSLDSKDNVNLKSLYEAIEKSQLNKNQQQLATTRLGIAEQYMLEKANLTQLVRPGSLTLLDLRDEMLQTEEAMRLCLIALKLFSNVKIDGHGINKLIILDEAHKYMGSAFAKEIETVVREMRHTSTSVIIASQDPLSIPDKVIGLSSIVICHRITDSTWVKHIKSSCEPLASLDPSQLSQLKPGEAFAWADKSTPAASDFVKGPMKINIRPRVTKPGG